jgi:opacity protein-like surface antigen
MNIRRTLTFAALVTGLGFAATSAHAGGIYVGGGIGDASIADTSSTPSGNQFDESASAWKAFAGYRFDLLPIVSLSAEVGYRDLGQPDAAALEYSVSGFDYAVLGGLGLGPIELFARVGGMQFDVEKTSSGATTKFDGTAPLYGIGASFALGSLGVRAEYEIIDIDELDDVSMVSVSGFWSF